MIELIDAEGDLVIDGGIHPARLLLRDQHGNLLLPTTDELNSRLELIAALDSRNPGVLAHVFRNPGERALTLPALMGREDD